MPDINNCESACTIICWEPHLLQYVAWMQAMNLEMPLAMRGQRADGGQARFPVSSPLSDPPFLWWTPR
jgi:hypothetical protein